MRAIVVYESHWGNTAAVARAVADGLGPEARALTTDEAVGPAIEGVDLIVAGAPVMALRLPTEGTLEGLAHKPAKDGNPPDLSHPSMRSWLAGLPVGHGRGAAFETGLRWSPGGATGSIESELRRSGYASITRSRRFVVTGASGPLKVGEIERAQAWGVELAEAMAAILVA
jgi:hypothetical protein